MPPRQTLTADQIVRAAIELLDDEGLDGLNMRSLGARLGTAATAIYWHIKTKDELVRLAADAIWSEVALPESEPEPESDPESPAWREAAVALARGMHRMLTRHPWLGQAFGSHLLYGPGKARFDDRTLAVYEQAGFAGQDADRAAATVFLYVLGSGLGAAAQVSITRRLGKDGQDPQQLLAESMARSVEIASAFPRLRERLDTAAAAEYAAAPDSSFEFGLAAVLDGLEARRDGRP